MSQMSPFYEVILQKIFFFTNEGFPKLMVTTVMMALYETRTIMVIIKGNFLFYPDDDDDDDDQDWSFGSGCTEGCIILHVI